jgi:hypothetical protein
MSASWALDRYENQILLAARMVREYYCPSQKSNSPDWVLIFAIRDLLTLRPETTPEEMFDQLITRSGIEADGHLSRYLAAAVTSAITCGDNAAANVFTGARKFSFEKISAMAAYITSRGEVCSTRLNKLLFYSDFVNYYLYGYSISGARYIRHGLGPALYGYESILKTLIFTGVVKVTNEGQAEENIIACEGSTGDELTVLETVTMHWVLANFRSLTGTEIDQYSQREIAFRFTRQDDFIAYEYARLLKALPERSML